MPNANNNRAISTDRKTPFKLNNNAVIMHEERLAHIFFFFPVSTWSFVAFTISFVLVKNKIYVAI